MNQSLGLTVLNAAVQIGISRTPGLGVHLLITLIETHNIVLLTPNSKNILLITTLVFFYGVHCTQVKFVYLVVEAKIDNFIKMKHEHLEIRYP